MKTASRWIGLVVSSALAATALIGAPAAAAAPEVELPPNCAGFWTLDGHTGDVTWAGSDAQPLGGTLGAPGRSPGRTAMHFDGSDRQGLVSRTVWGGPSSLTVSAWVRLTDTTGWHTAVSQNGFHGVVYRLAYNNTAKSWEFLLQHSGGGDLVARSTAVTPNTWTHLMAVYNMETRTLTLYVNGQATGSDQNYYYPSGGGEYHSIGRDHRRDANYEWVPGPGNWTGELADIGVWGRALDAAEIRALSDPTT
ncbi:MAG TPA: LamG domain-containing protein [Catenuloplanes sp.]|jgi:hypothetical protein